MTVEVQVSRTYTLLVEDDTFANGAPCMSLRMMFVGNGMDGPQERGHLRFDRKTVGSVIEAMERVRVG